MNIQRRYQWFGRKIQQMENLEKQGLGRTAEVEQEIEDRVKDYFPRGSGFDGGTIIPMSKCTTKRLVFRTAYHHMNDVGMYDGWTEHEVWVYADLAQRFTMRITGPDRNDIKNLIADTFSLRLDEWVDHNGNLCCQKCGCTTAHKHEDFCPDCLENARN